MSKFVEIIVECFLLLEVPLVHLILLKNLNTYKNPADIRIDEYNKNLNPEVDDYSNTILGQSLEEFINCANDI